MAKKEKQTKEKPLEKMTATELREVARELPEISGAYGMNKSELIAAIKEAKGIADTGGKKRPAASIRQVKEKLDELRKQREASLQADDKKQADILRRRISRLKKKTRRVS